MGYIASVWEGLCFGGDGGWELMGFFGIGRVGVGGKGGDRDVLWCMLKLSLEVRRIMQTGWKEQLGAEHTCRREQ